MLLKRCGPNLELAEHFLLHGTLQDVQESQITSLCTALGHTKIPKYQENRAATKSKLQLGFFRGQFLLLANELSISLTICPSLALFDLTVVWVYLVSELVWPYSS